MISAADRDSSRPSSFASEVAAGRMVIPANKVAPEGRLKPGIGSPPVQRERQHRKHRLLPAGHRWPIEKLHFRRSTMVPTTVMDLSTGKGSQKSAPHSSQPRPCRLAPGDLPMLEELGAKSKKCARSHSSIWSSPRPSRASTPDRSPLRRVIEHLHLTMGASRSVSRGGRSSAKWMIGARQAEPLYTSLTTVRQSCAQYDVT